MGGWQIVQGRGRFVLNTVADFVMWLIGCMGGWQIAQGRGRFAVDEWLVRYIKVPVLL